MGTGAIVKYHELAAKKAGGYGKVTLEHLYQAALQYATYTKARRQRVYRRLKDDPIEGAPPVAPQATPLPSPGLSIAPAGPHTLYLGETLQLKAEGAEKVRWSSAKRKIARVNKTGLVVPVKPKAWSAEKRRGAAAKVQVLEKPPLRALALSGPQTMRPARSKDRPVFTGGPVAPCAGGAATKGAAGNQKGVRALRPAPPWFVSPRGMSASPPSGWRMGRGKAPFRVVPGHLAQILDFSALCPESGYQDAEDRSDSERNEEQPCIPIVSRKPEKNGQDHRRYPAGPATLRAGRANPQILTASPWSTTERPRPGTSWATSHPRAQAAGHRALKPR